MSDRLDRRGKRLLALLTLIVVTISVDSWLAVRRYEPQPSARAQEQSLQRPPIRQYRTSAKTGDVRVDVRVRPYEVLTAQVVPFEIRVRDPHGFLSLYEVHFGDGAIRRQGGLIGPCHGPRKFVPSTKPDPALDRTIVVRHAYRRPGAYRVLILVQTSECRGEPSPVWVAAKALVRRGPFRSNGPERPRLTIRQIGPRTRDPRLTNIRLEAEDHDGYLHSISIDWGDRTPLQTERFPVERCREEPGGWPASARDAVYSHRHRPRGVFKLRVIATSVGCDGRDAQRSVASKLIQWPSPQTYWTSSSSRGNLHLSLRVHEPAVSTGADAKFTLSIMDSSGSLMDLFVRYGDGLGFGQGVRAGCEARRSGQRPRPPAPLNKTMTLEHPYKRAGVYDVSVEVRTGDLCGPGSRQETARIRGRVGVFGAEATSNGSEKPQLALAQVPGEDQGMTYIRIRAKDLDGYVSEIRLDWGDGSEPTVLSFPLADCEGPRAGWPNSHRTRVIAHRYPARGPWSGTARLTSVGCDGKHPQYAGAEAQLVSEQRTGN